MRTALATGRAGTGVPVHARILIAADPRETGDLTDVLSRLGHQVTERHGAEAVQTDAAGLTHDLIFADLDLVAVLPPSPGAPVIALVDDEGMATPAACIGTLTRSQAMVMAPTLATLAAELSELRARCGDLERLVGGVRDGSAIVGRSPVMRRMLGALSRAADGDATVLIEGAPGTGKSLVARAMHCKSRRSNRPIVVTEGQETDAESMVAAFGRARGSSLVIENVDQLPHAAQQALVRFLKERPGNAAESPAARIIATTSAHLPELVARGTFREDLYYRLHVLPLVTPSLRERPEDIAPLVRAVLDQCSAPGQQQPAGISQSALVMLEGMSWPGNVAQLETVVRRAHLAAAGAVIEREHLQAPGAPGPAPAIPATSGDVEDEISEAQVRPFEEEEQRLLSRALRATRGNVRRAAQLLGIGRATLYRKIQQYRLRLH